MELQKMKDQFFPSERPIVVDFFAGSANLLFQVSRQLNAIRAVGVEKNESIFNLTKENIKAAGFECDFYNKDY